MNHKCLIIIQIHLIKKKVAPHLRWVLLVRKSAHCPDLKMQINISIIFDIYSSKLFLPRILLLLFFIPVSIKFISPPSPLSPALSSFVRGLLQDAKAFPQHDKVKKIYSTIAGEIYLLASLQVNCYHIRKISYKH